MFSMTIERIRSREIGCMSTQNHCRPIGLSLSMIILAINPTSALKRLKHPCVLPIIYYIDLQPATSTTIATPSRIGTQYAPNGSLRYVLNKIESNNSPPFVNDTWLALTVTGIVIGMKYIHSIGWIHRDMKPENILIDENGHPLIGDLGSSRLVDLNVTMTRNIGSPRYMAPEMYEEGRYTNAILMFIHSQ